MASGDRFSGEDDFRAMKANYIKHQADSALKAGNVREAYLRYTECLDVMPTGYEDAHTLYGNRSLAYSRACKFDLALLDAEKACEMKPGWNKAWWRKASALKGRKQFAEALNAYKLSYSLTANTSSSNNEHHKAVSEITERMTREQLAEYIVMMLNDYEARGIIQPASEQNVTEDEKKEDRASYHQAMFCHIRNWQKDGKTSSTDYCKFVATYVVMTMSVADAYLQRACMFKEALCFKQVVVDASAAIKECLENGESSVNGMMKTVLNPPGTSLNTYREIKFQPRAWAWHLKGIGYRASKSKGEEGDIVKAAKCFKVATSLDKLNDDFRVDFENACAELSNAQMNELLNEFNQQLFISTFGITDEFSSDGKPFLLKGIVEYECSELNKFGSAERKRFKQIISSNLHVVSRKVLLERVHLQTVLKYQVHLGDMISIAKDFLEKASNRTVDFVLSKRLTKFLSHSGKVVEVHVREQLQKNRYESLEKIMLASDQKMKATPVLTASRPTLAMELPYRSYKRVHADGSAVERLDKHPFCISRVFYSDCEAKNDVWFEPDDVFSYRWQQSASEVRILIFGIQENVESADVIFDVKPGSLKMQLKSTGNVLLEGNLENSIIPDESFWDFDVTTRQISVYLTKANVSLFTAPENHSSTEWKRLFSNGVEVKWDDSTKDYSDLPSFSMNAFAKNEHRKDISRQIACSDESMRNRFIEADDFRRRSRQEKLATMRGSAYETWIALTRNNGA